MKLIMEAINYLLNITLRHKKCGEAIKIFCENMGVAYVKLAQILATQNYQGILKEDDREILLNICDDVAPVPFEEIESILRSEYGDDFDRIFSYIYEEQLGSASISQVHKAILKDGRVVAVKVKRKDVVSSINKDIETIKMFYNTFGWILKLTNKIGGNQALDLYLKWILEETDFVNEKNNIKFYKEFADKMNGKIEDANNIVILDCYEELCTENVIVMQYIESPTINSFERNEENRKRLSSAIGSYLKINFYAVLHDEDVVFHGDPHGGNIYIDDNNNVGFLDMGLIFRLTDDDKKLLRNFAVAAFSNDYEKIYDSLIIYGKMSDKSAQKFKGEIKSFCETIGEKDISCYFTGMIEICIKYELLPPYFLFCMSKAFLCLNGVNDRFKVLNTAKEIMQEQITEYLLKKSWSDAKTMIDSGLKLVPSIIESISENGLAEGISKKSSEILNAYADYKELVRDYEEFIKMLEANYSNTNNNQKKKTI